jgi:hypothetical protein
LANLANTLPDVRAELVWVAADAEAWFRDHWREAAQATALSGPEPGGLQPVDAPHAAARRTALGERRTLWLANERGYHQTYARLRPDRQTSERVAAAAVALSGLDEPAGRVLTAARAVAAARELDRRGLVDEVVQSVQERAGRDEEAEAPERPVAAREDDDPLRKFQTLVRGRRGALIADYAAALAPRLAELDDAVLQGLREALGDPWSSIEPRDAYTTQRIETDARPKDLRKREATIGQIAEYDAAAETSRGVKRRALERRAQELRDEAKRQWSDVEAHTQRLEALREDPQGLDRLVVEHPEVAVHQAVSVELARRAKALEPALDAAIGPAIAPAVEQAAAEIAGPGLAF